MDEFINQAEALIKALQRVRHFQSRLTVIKLGGSAMEDPAALHTTLQSIVALGALGVRPVLVHGGGKPIDRAMTAAGIVPKKIQGRRYTDEATLEIVVKVLTQEINANIVSQLTALGAQAVGYHTDSHQVLFGQKLALPNPGGDPIDLGWVGEVNKVNASTLEECCAQGIIPVIPSVAYDDQKHWLNVNADTAACAVAAHCHAMQLIMITDTPGILHNPKDPTTTIPQIDSAKRDHLVSTGIIDGGMLPKIEACYEALNAGVGTVHIIDGRHRYSLLLDLLNAPGLGTEIIL